MPTPRPDESEKVFIARCIPIVLKEGTARNQAQAVAVCASMHRQARKKMAGEK